MENSSNTLLGLLAGTAIGATLGLLFAPEKGTKIRKTITDEAVHLKDKIESEVNNLQDKVTSNFNPNKKSLDQRLEEVLDESTHKAEELISSLENRLTKLKEKNKELTEAA